MEVDVMVIASPGEKVAFRWGFGTMSRQTLVTHTDDVDSTLWNADHGKRSVGRPATRWSDDFVRYCGDDWHTLAMDEDRWEDHCSGFLGML